MQAGLLAQRDSRTPFLAVMFAAAVNLAGDWALITQYGMGIRGAAWATAGSQVAGGVVLLWTLQTFSVVRYAVIAAGCCWGPSLLSNHLRCVASVDCMTAKHSVNHCIIALLVFHEYASAVVLLDVAVFQQDVQSPYHCIMVRLGANFLL